MGREDELKDLEDLLARSGRVAIIAATGMGGIGKTQLAWQYAENHKNLYPGGIWWLRAESFGQQVFSYGQRMGLPTPPEITQEAEQMQWFYDQWLLQIPVGERLLVVDDVQDYGKLKPLLPSDQRFRVLLTTRKRLGSPVQVLEVPKLPLEKARELWEQLGVAAARLQAEPEAAQSLYDWVEGLPLGIELMGRYLAQRRGLKLGELLQRLETKKLSAKALLNLPEEMTYENNIRAAFDLSWEPLSQRAKQLGGLLSIFAVAPISGELLQNCLSEEDPEDLEDALHEELVRGSLVDELDPKVYQVHSLLHKFYGEKLGTELADRAETLQRSFAETLTAVAKTIDQTLTQGDILRITETLPHLEIVANELTHLLEDGSKITPSTRLAWVAKFQSRWQDAEHWYEKSLRISETQLVADHLDTATNLNNLAELYRAMGRYSDAEPLYDRSLHIMEIHLGADHPDTATSLNNLALLYYAMGRYSDAEKLYLRSFQIKETQLGTDHGETATSLNNLALLYEAMGRYSDAEKLYLRSFQITETRLGADHPSTASSLNNLAAIYYTMGRYSAAEPLYLRSLHIREAQLGGDHPDTAQSLNNLAELYRVMERYSEAEPLYLRSLQIKETQLGADHPDTGISLDNLAILYTSTGRYNEAEPLYQRVLHIIETRLGSDHPDTATSLSNLAELYRKIERYNDAESLLQRSLHICETQLGVDHPNAATCLNNLAGLYESMGRYSDAEPLYLQTLEIWTKSLGENHPDTQTAWGNFRHLLQQALAHGSADSLSDHPLTQQLLQELRERP